MIKKLIDFIRKLGLPKKQPCRRHYFIPDNFEDCKECGWNGTFTPSKNKQNNEVDNICLYLKK